MASALSRHAPGTAAPAAVVAVRSNHARPTNAPRRPLLALLATLILAPWWSTSAVAQAFQSYGLNFVTVGDPGNRAATPSEAPVWPTWAPPLGAVDHTFGIMRTNVTNEQWIEFVRAYAPYYQGNLNSPRLTGTWINYTGTVGGVPQYSMTTGAGQWSASMSWRVAARFCNWLHNGKVGEAWAFEDGAYDTSTFGEVVVGSVTMISDQATHIPGARYWIPSLDEYAKAAYYDPDRYGPGQPGYWIYPDKGNDPLVPGPPGVGQTGASVVPFPFEIDVESYPDTPTPWGLLDVSGTKPQYTEGWFHPVIGLDRRRKGSGAASSSYLELDRIDFTLSADPEQTTSALRIATVIPSPASLLIIAAGVSVAHARRRRPCELHVCSASSAPPARP